ncbi:hypothetical protein [Shewanella waksmanii]|uniref:hypothetical protein n=1 Tax=Shewanella waksmanii TaxID=213783 RepID=UPI00048EB4CE|nr:hypothetical protein [Shewanella waksmanii]
MKNLSLAVCLTLSLASGAALAKPLTEAQYIEIFQGDNVDKQKDAIASLVMAGLNDPQVYETLNNKLQASLPLAIDRHSIDYSAWLIKGLAYSGDEKYVATYNEIINGDYHSKLQKYAKKSLKNLEKYQVWAPILADKSHYDDKYNQRSNVLSNALRSDELQLKLDAAKRVINRGVYTDQVLKTLDSELQDTRLLKHDKLAIQAYAFMAKALASSGEEKYRPTIEKLAETSSERKLQRYAAKYLRAYY